MTGHLRILSYVALSGQVGKINHPPFISETTRSYKHPWCIISCLLCVYLRNPRSFTQTKGPKRISVRTNEDVRGCRRGNRIILRRQIYQEQFFLQQDVLHSRRLRKKLLAMSLGVTVIERKVWMDSWRVRVRAQTKIIQGLI